MAVLGRLRPNHTFGVIFAFGGSALMGTCYYVVQRTGHTRLALGELAEFTFWGWQLGCVLAMATMPLGITQSKEYAEPEWFIDIAVAMVWVSFGIVFFGTLRGGASGTSTSRTGTTARSSSRSPCCTSSTTSRCRYP